MRKKRGWFVRFVGIGLVWNLIKRINTTPTDSYEWTGPQGTIGYSIAESWKLGVVPVYRLPCTALAECVFWPFPWQMAIRVVWMHNHKILQSVLVVCALHRPMNPLLHIILASYCHSRKSFLNHNWFLQWLDLAPCTWGTYLCDVCLTHILWTL